MLGRTSLPRAPKRGYWAIFPVLQLTNGYCCMEGPLKAILQYSALCTMVGDLQIVFRIFIYREDRSGILIQAHMTGCHMQEGREPWCLLERFIVCRKKNGKGS